MIRANTAVDGGGALFQAGESFAISSNALTMTDSRMVNNRAGDRGSAMVTSGTVQIRSSEISNNTSENGPGAIEYTLVAQDNQALRLQGVLLSDNRSAAGAPVIRAEAPELSLQNVTLAAATADPSPAIELKELVEPSATTLRNVILANYAVGVVRPRESTLQGNFNIPMATLTGVPLYIAGGFVATTPLVITLPDDVPFPCVRMVKTLQTQPAQPQRRTTSPWPTASH